VGVAESRQRSLISFLSSEIEQPPRGGNESLIAGLFRSGQSGRSFQKDDHQQLPWHLLAA